MREVGHWPALGRQRARQGGNVSRVRVLLCEHDPALESVLLDLFAEEQIEAIRCDSFVALEAGSRQYPAAIIVSDSWIEGGLAQLTDAERQQLKRLAARTRVIMTTGRDWAKHAAG